MLYKWALAIGTMFDSDPKDPTLDPNCKNPTRSIRIPGVVRPETGKVQQLIELKPRIKVADFLAWLGKYEHLKPKQSIPSDRRPSGDKIKNLSPGVQKQLINNNIDFRKGRNKTWFYIACDMTKAGYIEEEIVEYLTSYFVEESDFKEKEFLTSIHSAYIYMLNKA
jgi:hypothetical protein